MIILVASSSGYSDAWEPFARLMQKFWPNRPYHTILLSDGFTDKLYAIKELPTVLRWALEDDKGWCANLAYMLSQVDNDLVLLMQEDFFLTNFVDQDRIMALRVWLATYTEFACLRLYPCPGADAPFPGEWGREISESLGIGEITKSADYRVSCQCAIWRKSYLKWLCEQPETWKTQNPSAFEIAGTELSRARPERFASVIRDGNPPISYLCSAITRGKWNPQAIPLARSVGVELDTERRPLHVIK